MELRDFRTAQPHYIIDKFRTILRIIIFHLICEGGRSDTIADYLTSEVRQQIKGVVAKTLKHVHGKKCNTPGKTKNTCMVDRNSTKNKAQVVLVLLLLVHKHFLLSLERNEIAAE
jgi:invasion protein IalB